MQVIKKKKNKADVQDEVLCNATKLNDKQEEAQLVQDLT